MKRIALILGIAAAMTIGAAGAATAAPGGAPAHTGLSGKDFGQMVATVAHLYPGAVADHIHGD